MTSAINAAAICSSELEFVVATQAREPNTGLVEIPDAFTIGHRAEITLAGRASQCACRLLVPFLR